MESICIFLWKNISQNQEKKEPEAEEDLEETTEEATNSTFILRLQDNYGYLCCINRDVA